MSRSRLGPMVKVAKMLRTHLWGIITAIVLKATNADLESTNAKTQALKKRAGTGTETASVTRSCSIAENSTFTRDS